MQQAAATAAATVVVATVAAVVVAVVWFVAATAKTNQAQRSKFDLQFAGSFKLSKQF